MQVQEEKVPDRHLGESEIGWSRAVFKLVSVPLYTPKKLMSKNPQQLFFIGVISINT